MNVQGLEPVGDQRQDVDPTVGVGSELESVLGLFPCAWISIHEGSLTRSPLHLDYVVANILFSWLKN